MRPLPPKIKHDDLCRIFLQEFLNNRFMNSESVISSFEGLGLTKKNYDIMALLVSGYQQAMRELPPSIFSSLDHKIQMLASLKEIATELEDLAEEQDELELEEHYEENLAEELLDTSVKEEVEEEEKETSLYDVFMMDDDEFSEYFDGELEDEDDDEVDDLFKG